MAHLRALIGTALICIGGAANAGYAYPADPVGFTRNGGAGFTGYGYSVSAANDRLYGRVIHQPNGLKVHVPGKPVTMPASYRLAANAPRVAAGIIFANPALRTGLAIAAWLGAAKIFWDAEKQQWFFEGLPENTPAEWIYYTVFDLEAGNIVRGYATATEACSAAVAEFGDAVMVSADDSFCVYSQKGVNRKLDMLMQRNSCPPNTQWTPAGCLVPQPEVVGDPADFARRILNPDNQPGWPNVPADWPMPERVPFELPPGTPLPVEQPFINPQPSPNPQHRPLFVPNGDPVPNPNYDPNAQPSPENQPWIQPGVRLNPSPTPQEPFRIDVQPVERPQETPDPMPEPQPEDQPNPGDKPKPEETQSLCEKHPDIIACQKLDEPEPEQLEERAIPFDFAPETGFGGAGACPAPIVANVAGRSLQFSWQPFCDSLSMARNLILAFAWLCAGFIMLGARAD